MKSIYTVGVDASSNLFNILLHICVHCRVNLKTLGVNHSCGGISGNVIFLCQIISKVKEEFINVPVLNLCFFLFFLLVITLEFHLFRFFQGVLIFFLGNFALTVHFFQNNLTAFLVVFRINKRVPFAWVLCNACYCGTFCNGAVLNILAKVKLGSRLTTLTVVTEVYNIEVCLKNFILGVFVFKVEGSEYFSQFSCKRNLVVICDVLYKLLSYCRTAVAVASRYKGEYSTACSLPVNTAMLIKTLVLNGNHCVLHLLRNILEVNPYTVFTVVQCLIFLVLVGVLILYINVACKVKTDVVKVNACWLGCNSKDIDTKADTHGNKSKDKYHKDCKNHFP